MTHSMLRRQLKNLVQNFSEAEVKVREATSNDPWGPSSSQMTDISDLTYNMVACNEIMSMLFKRLNDIAKNWRHVYKSLTLLEYILKTGSDRVVQQCQENVHVVKPLTEFRFTDKDGKDQGINVREKAKIVLLLIEDPEKLKEERELAMKTKDKLAKASSAAAEALAEKDKPVVLPYTGLPSLDNIPSVADLTACMAAKKEEQRRLEAKRKEEERRAKEGDTEPDLWEQSATAAPPSNSDPWGAPGGEAQTKNDPWGGSSEDTPAGNDPWGDGGDVPKDSGTTTNDPWGGSGDTAKESPPASSDPWGEPAEATGTEAPASNDPWGDAGDTSKDTGSASNDPWGAPSDAPAEFTSDTSDAWGAPVADTSSDDNPASSDPWGAPSDAPTTTSDPWGGGGDVSATAPSDPFGDSTKADNDPWGSSAPQTASSNDPWGTPAAPSDSMAANNDPWGDGSSTATNAASTDPWGTPTESATNGNSEADESKAGGSFLGDAASLVNLDSLLSTKPKPKQPPLNAIPTTSAAPHGKEG
ncbi:epsin-1 isoform X2 [Denticeps clupeoides]|uniref:epsin-1 isoform X2 n=1 Tax=Denticeps clupeoides TaxID=299321 RepID=UPI0010A5364E|nr:epsin-1-like isoform X2 [Denticeps clupeoides]